MKASLRIQMVVDVTYSHDESGDMPDEQRCKDQLEYIIRKAAGDGELSGWEDDLVVDRWSVHTKTISEN